MNIKSLVRQIIGPAAAGSARPVPTTVRELPQFVSGVGGGAVRVTGHVTGTCRPCQWRDEGPRAHGTSNEVRTFFPDGRTGLESEMTNVRVCNRWNILCCSPTIKCTDNDFHCTQTGIQTAHTVDHGSGLSVGRVGSCRSKSYHLYIFLLNFEQR